MVTENRLLKIYEPAELLHIMQGWLARSWAGRASQA
jgi:hypothetical protein